MGNPRPRNTSEWGSDAFYRKFIWVCACCKGMIVERVQASTVYWKSVR